MEKGAGLAAPHGEGRLSGRAAGGAEGGGERLAEGAWREGARAPLRVTTKGGQMESGDVGRTVKVVVEVASGHGRRVGEGKDQPGG